MLPEEVDLRRILHKLEAVKNVGEEGTPPEGLQLAKYQAYVDHMKGLLDELRERDADTDRLDGYADEIHRVTSVLELKKLITWPLDEPLLRRRHDIAPGRRSGRNAFPAQSSSSPGTVGDRIEQPQVSFQSLKLADARRELLGKTEDSWASSKVDTGRDDLLAHHRQTQDALSNDLVNMAQALKANALNLGQLLDQDRKVLEEADSLLTANLSRTQKESLRLKTLNSNTRKTTLYSWLAIILVALIFFGMYFLIRVT